MLSFDVCVRGLEINQAAIYKNPVSWYDCLISRRAISRKEIAYTADDMRKEVSKLSDLDNKGLGIILREAVRLFNREHELDRDVKVEYSKLVLNVKIYRNGGFNVNGRPGICVGSHDAKKREAVYMTLRKFCQNFV